MGLMPRENRKPKGNAQVKAARVSANSDRYSLIADFFAEGSGTKYVSVLPGYTPIAKVRRLQNMFQSTKKSQRKKKSQGKKPDLVVLAKAEGSSGGGQKKKKDRKGKGKAQ